MGGANGFAPFLLFWNSNDQSGARREEAEAGCQRFPLAAPKSGTFGLLWRGTERRVLSMPRGPSAGITIIRYTEPEVPREESSVSKRAEGERVEAESR